jgi:xanthine dehydrogenase accessory factor
MLANPITQQQRPGGMRAVLDATLRTLRNDASATLAVVLETEGSTYVKAGAMVYFGAGTHQIGWLSGGCLEPELRRRADTVAVAGAFDVIDIDTRDDEDLFSGSAIGCRGRLRVLLLPLQRLPRGDELIEAWRNGVGALTMRMHEDGRLEWQVGAVSKAWRLQRVAHEHPAVPAAGAVALTRPAQLLMLGAGPEAPVLLPQLRALDWFVTAVDRRERWQSNLAQADVALSESPEAAIAHLRMPLFAAALVMHHHFELDRSALQALADSDIPFIGLLGPRRRRDDLFKLLPEPARTKLEPRLRSPVGLDLGGLGIDSIALSIAAQLQCYLHER